MNTVRMGIIAICLAVGASGYLSLRGAATDEAQPPQATRTQPTQRTRTQTANSAARAYQAVTGIEEHAPDERTLNTVREPAFEPDTSELLQPSATFDELLDAITADIGLEGEQVDREALAALLRSDPELARMSVE